MANELYPTLIDPGLTFKSFPWPVTDIVETVRSRLSITYFAQWDPYRTQSGLNSTRIMDSAQQILIRPHSQTQKKCTSNFKVQGGKD